MASEAGATLRALDVPAAAVAVVETLPEEDQDRFAQVVVAAIAADTERIEKALAATLKIVPAPLRPRARALLFPGDAS